MRNLIRTPRYLGHAWPNGLNAAIGSDGEWHTITLTSSDAALIVPSAWLRLVPGMTYTLMGRVRVYEGSQFGGTQTNSLWVYIGGQLLGTAQPPGVNVPGEYDLRLPFVVPQSTTGVTTFRLYSGRQAPSDWTNLMLVEGNYRGGFADGDTPGWVWTGERGNSPSIGPGVIT
ncbi:hypothetical protein AVL63_02950 [Nesterenkonia jeotgali]|uniref:Uncharacterized protein n=1 Tax=Nesterenkonia jeotgali TaxID=317018 RepID=A0A0W8IGF5_9MICC|nr:hypothetical protein AVL63_02950 [Nesterenkonia jeotgali]